MERFTRRQFFIKVAALGLGATSGAGFYHEQTSWPDSKSLNQQITPEVLAQLKPLEEQISNQIMVSNPLAILNLMPPTISVSVIRENFSAAIIRLAFLDGGIETANQVASLVETKGLRLVGPSSEATKDFIMGGWVNDNYEEPDKPVEMGFGFPGFYGHAGLSLDLICFHEMYHVIQLARNPSVMAGIPKLIDFVSSTSAAAIALWLLPELYKKAQVISKYNNTILHRTNTLLMSSLIFGFIRGLASLVQARYLNPIEKEAHIKTGTDESTTPLLDLSQLDDLKGKFFSYEIS